MYLIRCDCTYQETRPHVVILRLVDLEGFVEVVAGLRYILRVRWWWVGIDKGLLVSIVVGLLATLGLGIAEALVRVIVSGHLSTHLAGVERKEAVLLEVEIWRDVQEKTGIAGEHSFRCCTESLKGKKIYGVIHDLTIDLLVENL